MNTCKSLKTLYKKSTSIYRETKHVVG